ncbi:MAG: glycosyltransferase, partial [Candidatus Marinimicrobia bacterium]|nr:glycosyltransferase [Candidatus Neomarinimicrobiota bacterium]
MMNLFIIIFSLFISGYVISLIYFSILTDRYNSKTSDNLFSISVIISLHNEEKNVQHLMQSLLAQKYPKDQIEFIFVNDRSVDKTGNLLDSYSKEDSQITVIHITKKQKNIAPKKFAIDSAINIAKGEIILFTDADARHDKEWAKTMTSYFTEKVGMVLGNVTYNTNRKIKSLLFRLVHLDFFSISAIGLSTVSMKYPATCIGTNMAVRKKVYEELGGYGKYKNIQSGDDDLLMQRVRDEGDWEIEYATDKRATVFTFP